MSADPPAISLAYCQQARELLAAISDAVHELVKHHQDQFQAVISGDLDSMRFDDLIHMANERKRDAKYAYLYHLETHGCSKLAPEDFKARS
jgi:hypothetical protein